MPSRGAFVSLDFFVVITRGRRFSMCMWVGGGVRAPLPTRETLHIFKNDSRSQKGNRINLKCEVFQVDARGVSEQ